jgi:NAD(P)-dependent dehydrogenase (short-subunit alcohol dehydrogenase family)
MPFTLKNRTVLITGGSRGLGAVISAKFAAEGCNLAINYAASEEPAQALATRLRAEHGVRVIVLRADCGVVAECEGLVRATIEEFGGLHVIVGNAVSF